MFSKLIKTDGKDYTLLVLRIVLGLVIFAHGAQKLFGIWGGHGVEWTIEAWKQWWQIPGAVTLLVIIIESIGALSLVIGFCTRIWAILIGAVMIVAVYLVHLRWGFYMNWYMEPKTGEGFEYHILVLSIITVLLLKGGGKWSIDYYIQHKFTNKLNNK